jgi:hypothetical protein
MNGKSIGQVYLIINGKKRVLTAFEIQKYLPKKNEWTLIPAYGLDSFNKMPNF